MVVAVVLPHRASVGVGSAVLGLLTCFPSCHSSSANKAADINATSFNVTPSKIPDSMDSMETS